MKKKSYDCEELKVARDDEYCHNKSKVRKAMPKEIIVDHRSCLK